MARIHKCWLMIWTNVLMKQCLCTHYVNESTFDSEREVGGSSRNILVILKWSLKKGHIVLPGFPQCLGMTTQLLIWLLLTCPPRRVDMFLSDVQGNHDLFTVSCGGGLVGPWHSGLGVTWVLDTPLLQEAPIPISSIGDESILSIWNWAHPLWIWKCHFLRFLFQ